MRSELEACQNEIRSLKAELAVYKNPKNSGNSSIPPSKDENRARGDQSLREKSGKKSGGQPGHKGSTLSMVSEPDQVIDHLPGICGHCGKDLSSIEPFFIGKRQIVEIPPIKPFYIEHRVYGRKCGCGQVCEGFFPGHVKAPIQYGGSVANLVAYLSVRHYVPYRRSCEIFENVFLLPLSEGSVKNLLQAVAAKLYPCYMQIKDQVSNSMSVGADETTAIFAGLKGWFWIWQDRLNSFVTAAMGRGAKVRAEHFPDGFPGSVVCSDAYPVHLSTPCKAHQLCIAHLLRDLNYFIGLYPFNPWPQRLKSLFNDALELKKSMGAKDYGQNPARDSIEKSFRRLLRTPPAPKGKLLAFFNRMLKNQDSVFTFLYYQEVPPDNNRSERGIRNVKVKQKVSGQFKTLEGGQTFAIIRSVIDTFIKRDLNILNSLANLPNLVPE